MGIRKGNDVFYSIIISFMMILMFSSLKTINCANTNDDCFMNCVKGCAPQDYQCYDRCGWNCPHDIIANSDYYNIGCSLRHCSKFYIHEWRICRAKCATNICNVKGN
ncbi:hypothetical protein R3W88_029106 [Solanum pinnatisectum]|uniref:Uncharacterized protein n=1 Tax=Solanum pinnatisectum TaxID=50273 RepID=A0AAV9K4B6_9SOLN|nr:hypothetical protein R3W88_029106 [Solanum pinnatisectum]